MAAAIIGVISPSGNEIGPFLSVEQASLTQLVSDRERTRSLLGTTWSVPLQRPPARWRRLACPGTAEQRLACHRLLSQLCSWDMPSVDFYFYCYS